MLRLRFSPFFCAYGYDFNLSKKNKGALQHTSASEPVALLSKPQVEKKAALTMNQL